MSRKIESAHDRYKRLAIDAKARLAAKLAPTICGRFRIPSAYQLPKVELPPFRKPSRPLPDVLTRFYSLLRPLPTPLAEKLIRTATYVVPAIRIFRYPAHYQITVTRNPEEDKHLAMLYYVDSYHENHPLAGIFLPINFYSTPATKSAIASAVLHRQFKHSIANQHTLIPL